MRRILIAIRAFFVTLFSADAAAEVEQCLSRRRRAEPVVEDEGLRREPKREPSPRSEALTLLSTLQREARFVDFVKEPLADYTDAQVGAVARDVHRDCGKVLERLFSLTPIVEEKEGAEIEVPAGFDPGRYRLTGNVTGQPPFRGRMTHHGWEAAKCQLPAFSGSDAAARLVAPVEVELE